MTKKIDKRTKAYKDSIKKSEGLGDTIEKITKATGIKKVVEWLSNGKDCGCDERKKWLNEHARYKSECMVESEYIWFTEYLTRHNEKSYSKGDVLELVRLYRRLFKIRMNPCVNCNSGIRTMKRIVRDINIVYKSYE